MWIWLAAKAKTGAGRQAIEEKRNAWVGQGKERELLARCRSAQRYVISGQSPPEVFWLIETEDRTAADMITEHFGELWDITVLEVIPQAIGRAASS